MAQILSSSIKLNEDQVETTVNNLAKIRHFNKVEVIFEGKPSFAESNLEKMKELGIVTGKVTKFANNYKIYKFSDVRTNDSVKTLLSYNPGAKIKNLEPRVEFLILVDSDKFDKQFYLAVVALYPYIHEDLLRQNKSSVKNEPDSDENCYVTIASTNIITSSIAKHFNDSILPCNYRIFSLCDVYPLIGSKRKLYGFTKDFEVMENEILYNKCSYPIILDSDPMVKILNARNGDLIICQHLLFETTPYWEYSIRKVEQCLNESDSVDISGLYVAD